VDKDEPQASAHFLKAAMLEHHPAQVELARRYLTGVGLAVDPAEAFAWYDVAATQGHAPAATTRDGMIRQLTAAQVSAGRARSAALLREIASRKAGRLRP
jgi:TPR repeat protein